MPTITLPSGRNVDLSANPTGSTEGIPSNLSANHPAGWDPAYGGVPEIPDPIASAWRALGGNVDLLPGLFSLGNAYNLFNYDQRLGQVQGTPGFEGVLSNLSGQLPQDVVNQIAQRSAERGISSGGAPDSPNLNAAYLRSLGLTSLDQQKTGQNQLNALLGQFQQAAPFNLMSGLVTSEEEQAALNAANQNAGAPNPRDAALEDQRKLLEAIAAGKAAGGGPTGSGGLDYSKILDLLNGMRNTNPPPGNPVGNGPRTTDVPHTVPTFPSSLPPLTTRTDPGVSGLIQPDRGRPTDFIQNAFNTPDAHDVGTLGGVGINPQLNALLGGGGLWGHLNSNDFANYGGGGPSGVNSFAGPWNNPQGTVTNDYSQYSPTDWAQFGNPFTSNGVTYDNFSGGAFGGPNGGVNPNNYAFGTPITSRDLYSGQTDNWWDDPENLFAGESLSITPEDMRLFGSPITAGDLYGGSGGNLDTFPGFGSGDSLSSNGDILDFLDLYG